MKITEVKAIPIRMPLERIFPGSTYEIKVRCTIITEVYIFIGHSILSVIFLL